MVNRQRLRNEIYSAGNLYRRVADIMDTDKFKDLWAKSTPEEIKEFQDAVKAWDADAVSKWYTYHRARDLEDYTKDELVTKATRLHIPYRTQMSKFQLAQAIKLREIEYAEQVRKSQESSKAVSTNTDGLRQGPSVGTADTRLN